MRTNRAEAAAAHSRQAVKEELQQLLGDLEELVRRIGEASDPELELLNTRVRSLIASTRDAIEDRARQPVRRARQALSAGRTYVYERPWQVAGIAGLLGVMIGVLYLRR